MAAPIYIAGRYNKYLRNLSQTPWVDKQDNKVKNSVQELLEVGLYKYLSFSQSVFSSSGREDVDVRMLGSGRPFVFRLIEPITNTINPESIGKLQQYINETNKGKIKVRNLQLVTKADVSNNLKEGEEYKQKEYRALCCCSRKLTDKDIKTINNIKDLIIYQKTPVRVLHRRSAMIREKRIFSLEIEDGKSLLEFNTFNEDYIERLFVLRLLTEAGTYIKEFVHGDFGRTNPNMSTLLGDDCQVDLLELDVMEIYLDWPPALSEE